MLSEMSQGRKMYIELLHSLWNTREKADIVKGSRDEGKAGLSMVVSLPQRVGKVKLGQREVHYDHDG